MSWLDPPDPRIHDRSMKDKKVGGKFLVWRKIGLEKKKKNFFPLDRASSYEKISSDEIKQNFLSPRSRCGCVSRLVRVCVPRYSFLRFGAAQRAWSSQMEFSAFLALHGTEIFSVCLQAAAAEHRTESRRTRRKNFSLLFFSHRATTTSSSCFHSPASPAFGRIKTTVYRDQLGGGLLASRTRL